MNEYENIKIKEITVNARPGSSSSEGIKECIQLSFEKNTTILFFHNNSKFVINSDAIIKNIFKSESSSGKME